MKNQRLASDNYALQFKSQTTRVLEITIAITIEDITYHLNNRDNALIIALMVYQFISPKRERLDLFDKLFFRYDIDRGVLDTLDIVYSNQSVIIEILKHYAVDSEIKAYILDLILSMNYILNDKELNNSLPFLYSLIKESESSQLRKSILINSVL